MRIVKAVAAAVAILTLACASPGVPPGGPVDSEAPQIVRIAPDSGKTSVSPKELIFRFNEVVSERPSGAQSLDALFLISPREGSPRVDWNRDEIAVRPRRGWRKNTAYTITLLPGLSDLRGNTRNTGAVTMFSTGANIPTAKISGVFYNWAEGRTIPRGLIEARARLDTTIVYVTTTDSVGRFALQNMPAGSYNVRAILDDNNNKGLDPRESWDSAGAVLGDSARVELYGFVHDSIGSRLSSVTYTDSVTLQLNFDNPLAIAPPLTAANVRVRASDSTDVAIVSVLPPARDTAVAGVPRLARPIPARSLTVKMSRQLKPGGIYRVQVTDARNLMGVARTSERSVTVPATPVPARAPSVVAPPATAPPPAPVKR